MCGVCVCVVGGGGEGGGGRVGVSCFCAVIRFFLQPPLFLSSTSLSILFL